MLVPHRKRCLRPLPLVAAIAVFVLAGGVRAQVVTVNQSFTGATVPGWSFGGNGAYTPTLSGTANGLTLTTNAGNEATYAYDTSAFSSANATIAVQFTYSASNGSAQPADGITFFLANAATISSQGFNPGAYGGSLGYAQKTTAGTGGVGGGSNINGMVGGYLGLGLDQYGNYSNGTEGRIGGINTPNLTPNAIAVRGPGSGLNGYNYLGGTQTLPTNFSATASSTPVVTNFELTISATNQVVVYMEQGSVYTQIFTADLSGYSRPANMILGFTGSTGGQDSTQQIANVLLTSVTANLWTNTGADSKWGTTNNWFGNPTNAPGSAASAGNPSDVLLNNAYVSSAQTISLNGNTQTLRALDIDAPFSYTVGSAAHDGTIVFNNEGVLGPSGIYVTQTTGTATQTVNSDLVAKNAINIQNNTTSALNLNGNLDTQGNAITFNGSGATNLAGVISNSTGSGSIIQSGTGTTTFSGANTYAGGTTISAGTLNANSSTALGTGAVALSGATLGSTNGSTINNTINLGGNSTLSGITTGGTLNSSGSYTLNMANATQSGAVNLSTGASANTLTVEVDSGTSAINGVIANGTAAGDSLTKTGNGTLTLGGSDTYTGTTTITGGTIALGKSSVLAKTSNLNIGSNGTLNLEGFNQQVGTLAAASGATLNFGTLNSGNSFVFGSYTPPASGIFTINNWGASDQLADVTGGQNVSTIYISGVGLATEQGTTTSITNLGGANAYLLLPSAPTQIVWSGTASALWSKGGSGKNWNGSAIPANGQVAVFNSVGQAQNNVNVDTPTANLQGIQFGASSTVSYTLGGANAITLGSNAVPVPYIQQFNSLNQTISTTGGVVLGANAVTNETNTGNLIISSAISGAFNLVNDGTSTGKLVLSSATGNTFTSLFDDSGIVQISGNSGALGTGAATISGGAGLEITGGISPTNAISISGTGASGAGVLHNVGGTNTLSGTITEAANSTIAADSGTTLNLTGNLTGTNTNTTFVGPGTITASDVTTGTGTVTLSSGTLTFNGANTYTGATTVNGGTLNLSGTGVTVDGSLTVNSGGAVAQTTSNQINAASTLTMNGGTYNLNGNAQTLTSLTGASGATVTVGTGGNLTVDGAGSSTYAGALSGAGTITQSGTGEMALTGSSAGFTGNLALTQGIVNVSGNNNVLGTGTVAVSGTGNFEVQGGLNLANNFTLSTTGASSGNGAIENMSGVNTVSGTVALAGSSFIQSDAGTLTLSNTVSLGSGGNGYNLDVGGSGNTTLSGVIQNGGTAAGSLTQSGTGTLTLSGANTFTGATTVSSGTLTAGAANVLKTTSGVTVGGATGSAAATLNLGNFNQTVANLNLGATGTLTGFGSGAQTLTLTGAGNILGGTMTGATGTLVIGAGTTLTLNASFSDPGLTIDLNGGTLVLNGTAAATTDSFGALNITGSSTIDFGTGAATTHLTDSSLTMGTGATLTIDNWVDEQDYFYATSFTGATYGADGVTPEDQIIFNGFSSNNGMTTKWLSWDNEITPVPEPATYGAIFIGACLGFFLLRRLPRRKLAVVKV